MNTTWQPSSGATLLHHLRQLAGRPNSPARPAGLRRNMACAGSRLLLASVVVLAASTAVQAEDFEYTTNENTIAIVRYIGVGGTVAIPDTIHNLPVTSIDAFAFENRTDVIHVTIGTNVTSIGPWAFRGCTALISVTIPAAVTSIGDAAFAQNTSLISVAIPDAVTSIGEAAFAYSTSLIRVTIPDAVTSIGNGTFSDCTSLTSVTIGNGVASIAVYAFYHCTNLTSVYFKGDAPSSVDANAFEGVNATVYYLPGTTGWDLPFGGYPKALWKPSVQISDGSFGVRTNQFGFNISWASGMVVVVEACASPANSTWSPLQTNTLTGESFYFSDPQWTNHPARFYRLRWP
ncbi:MAG: leucine-rich repeat domain-containing protein [Verrucomicrobia bacterium]|nr:leucine-rich repeat domain-containing protein [Verrucomicrobiota bacterium]